MIKYKKVRIIKDVDCMFGFKRKPKTSSNTLVETKVVQGQVINNNTNAAQNNNIQYNNQTNVNYNNTIRG